MQFYDLLFPFLLIIIIIKNENDINFEITEQMCQIIILQQYEHDNSEVIFIILNVTFALDLIIGTVHVTLRVGTTLTNIKNFGPSSSCDIFAQTQSNITIMAFSQ